MKDELTEELTALRRFRARRLKQLLRELDKGQKPRSISSRNTSRPGLQETPAEKSPPRSRLAIQR